MDDKNQKERWLSMGDFGLFAVDQRLKVTNNIKEAGKLVIIPCQIGFKQKNGAWVNEWVDVLVFASDLIETARQTNKGEQITVSGRLTMSEYNNKKSLQILCDTLESGKSRSDNPLDDMDIPF